MYLCRVTPHLKGNKNTKQVVRFKCFQDFLNQISDLKREWMSTLNNVCQSKVSSYQKTSCKWCLIRSISLKNKILFEKFRKKLFLNNHLVFFCFVEKFLKTLLDCKFGSRLET